MHDPEFEKEVQKKMEELEFTPSEGVWMNLQRGLRKEERRRVPMLWLFFLLGGILLGAGGVSLYYLHRQPSGITGGDRPGIASAGGSAVAGTGGSDAAGADGSRVAGTASTEARVAANAPVNVDAGSAGVGPIGKVEGKSAGREITDGETANGETVKSGMVHGEKVQGGIVDENKVEDEPAGGKMINEGLVNGRTDNGKIAITSMGLLLHQEPAGNIDYRPGDRSHSPHVKGLMAIFPATAMSKRAAKKARFAAHPSWEAGFAGGGGLSTAIVPASGNIDPQSFQPTLVNSLQTPASLSGHIEMRISRIQPDLSFWAGIFVQRSVMKRLSFTAGLNLHYFSTRLETMQLKTGYTTNNVTPLSASGTFYGNSPYVQPAGSGSSYYGADYRSNNHYYFLQLPVSLQWQVNRSRKTPIFWEGGLSLSRLISANALYYSEKSGEYYKDGGAATPYHLMVFSSLMVGLSLGGNSIKIGPEAQYGLTSLIYSANVDNQHLFYGGIKITIVPRKW